MKKVKLAFCFIFLIALFALAGCGKTTKDIIIDNLSDIRYNLFVAEDEHLYATISSGMRENPYAYDGKSNSKTEFGIISVTFFNARDEMEIPYSIEIDGISTSGNLEENPYAHTFMVDIEKLVDDNSTIYLTLNGETPMLMTCLSKEWQINYNIALDIAIENVGENISQFIETKNFVGECYLKIVTDENNATMPYYWYFGIIKNDGNSLSVFIDVNSGEVLASNNQT